MNRDEEEPRFAGDAASSDAKPKMFPFAALVPSLVRDIRCQFQQGQQFRHRPPQEGNGPLQTLLTGQAERTSCLFPPPKAHQTFRVRINAGHYRTFFLPPAEKLLNRALLAIRLLRDTVATAPNHSRLVLRGEQRGLLNAFVVDRVNPDQFLQRFDAFFTS